MSRKTSRCGKGRRRNSPKIWTSAPKILTSRSKTHQKYWSIDWYWDLRQAINFALLSSLFSKSSLKLVCESATCSQLVCFILFQESSLLDVGSATWGTKTWRSGNWSQNSGQNTGEHMWIASAKMLSLTFWLTGQAQGTRLSDRSNWTFQNLKKHHSLHNLHSLCLLLVCKASDKDMRRNAKEVRMLRCIASLHWQLSTVLGRCGNLSIPCGKTSRSSEKADSETVKRWNWRPICFVSQWMWMLLIFSWHRFNEKHPINCYKDAHDNPDSTLSDENYVENEIKEQDNERRKQEKQVLHLAELLNWSMSHRQ